MTEIETRTAKAIIVSAAATARGRGRRNPRDSDKTVKARPVAIRPSSPRKYRRSIRVQQESAYGRGYRRTHENALSSSYRLTIYRTRPVERNTRQREAIKSAIEQSKRPLSPQEILDEAQTVVRGLGLATVYRNLKLLVSEGAVRSITLPGDSPRYETAEMDHHHHFQCTRCQRVFDMPGCPGEWRRLAPRGFTVEDHEVTLYGRCSDCGKRSARSSL